MKKIRVGGIHSAGMTALALAAGCTLALAQGQNPGWRRAGDPPPAQAPQPGIDQQDPSEPVDRSAAGAPPQTDQAYGGPNDSSGQAPPYSGTPQLQRRPPAYGLPAHLTLQPGTFLSVRIDEPISSDRNNVGDPFTATLMQPLVVDGVVVANPGQAVYGRVAAVQKHHADKPSGLGIELTALTLADGTQLRIHSQLIGRRGPTTPGAVQAGTVAGTTAVGATIGAIAGWGTGAAIGAGAGAAAGLVGVLLTRNHPTVIYPESALTFRVDSPATIATDRAPQAFRFVGPGDYDRPVEQRVVQARPPAPYGPYPRPYFAGPYAYPYPYYWGPSVGVIWGGGWYRGHRFRRW